jgi:membrane associated rhomboid family serine protease
MILIPIGRDDAVIDRHAWVSYTIIALNVIAFIITGYIGRSSRMIEINQVWRKAIQYAYANPQVTVPLEMMMALDPRVSSQLAESRRPLPVAGWSKEAEQKEMNRLAGEALAALATLPTIRFGYIPRTGGVIPLLTSLFVHAGFLHLLGNMLFFFLSGPFIEDVYGRPLFIALYVAGGIVATMSYALRHPESTIPLVGASGAIAAVMGAYFVRFFRSKIELLFIPFLIRPTLNFRFFLPAFVVLPAWLLQQLLESAAEGSGAGTAFTAHIGGFVFGAAMAVLIRMSKFEEKIVRPAVLKQTTWQMDQRLVRAMEAQRLGAFDTAQQQVQLLLREQPGHVDGLRLALDVAKENRDAAAIESMSSRLLTRYIEQHDSELANGLIDELTTERPRIPRFYARAAQYAEKSDNRALAKHLHKLALEAEPDSANAVQSLVRLGTLLRLDGDMAGARDAFDRARSHPACTPVFAKAIEAKIAQV